MAVKITRDANPILGDDFYLVCEAKRNKKGPLNLTSAKIYVTFKTALTLADGSATLQKNSTDHASYFSITDATAGKFEVIVPGTDTDDFSADTDYYVDVQVLTSGGALVTVVYDVVRFDQGVTRATT
jgi:hypothetical protein